MTGFEVQVAMAAPQEQVWSALTTPEEIRQWFGWDHPGLDEEIRYIFVDHAAPVPPDRLGLAGGQEIQLTADGQRTVLRVVMPGEPGDGYDAMAEGWRLFFEQLRFRLERRPAGPRRTLRLTGPATGMQLLAVLEAAGVKEDWHDSRYLRMVVDTDGMLVAAAVERPLTDGEPGPASITVTTHDGGDPAVRRAWVERWRAVLGEEPSVE